MYRVRVACSVGVRVACGVYSVSVGVGVGGVLVCSMYVFF